MRQDSAALQEILSYLRTTGAAPLVGLTGSGQITYPKTSGDLVGSVTITVSAQGTRMDVESPDGATSQRFGPDGYGAFSRKDGTVHHVSAFDAEAGLLPLFKLRSSSFPSSQISIIDGGVVHVDGEELQRVRVTLSGQGDAAAISKAGAVPIDFYFDPATNLLVKTASLSHAAPPPADPLITVISYGDYRPADGVQLPFQISKSANGQILWHMHIQQWQAGAASSQSDFRF